MLNPCFEASRNYVLNDGHLHEKMSLFDIHWQIL